MKLNPVETMPLDTLIGVYGTVLNERDTDMGNHFCFGYASQLWWNIDWKKKYKVYPRKKKYVLRKRGIEFNVYPYYFYPLNVVNIVGWFHPPTI